MEPPRGGGDIPEDWAGGLRMVLRDDMRWQSQTKVLIHMCDAPPHGVRYHNGVHDDYPDGDPKGSQIEDLVAEIGRKGIDYVFVETNGAGLDKVAGIIKTAFDAATTRLPMTTLKLDDRFDRLKDVVVASVSVSRTFSKSVSRAGMGTAAATSHVKGLLDRLKAKATLPAVAEEEGEESSAAADASTYMTAPAGVPMSGYAPASALPTASSRMFGPAATMLSAAGPSAGAPARSTALFGPAAGALSMAGAGHASAAAMPAVPASSAMFGPAASMLSSAAGVPRPSAK